MADFASSGVHKQLSVYQLANWFNHYKRAFYNLCNLLCMQHNIVNLINGSSNMMQSSCQSFPVSTLLYMVEFFQDGYFTKKLSLFKNLFPKKVVTLRKTLSADFEHFWR